MILSLSPSLSHSSGSQGIHHNICVLVCEFRWRRQEMCTPTPAPKNAQGIKCLDGYRVLLICLDDNSHGHTARICIFEYAWCIIDIWFASGLQCRDQRANLADITQQAITRADFAYGFPSLRSEAGNLCSRCEKLPPRLCREYVYPITPRCLRRQILSSADSATTTTVIYHSTSVGGCGVNLPEDASES
jgi:hypothetical protein